MKNNLLSLIKQHLLKWGFPMSTHFIKNMPMLAVLFLLAIFRPTDFLAFARVSKITGLEQLEKCENSLILRKKKIIDYMTEVARSGKVTLYDCCLISRMANEFIEEKRFYDEIMLSKYNLKTTTEIEWHLTLLKHYALSDREKLTKIISSCTYYAQLEMPPVFYLINLIPLTSVGLTAFFIYRIYRLIKKPKSF